MIFVYRFPRYKDFTDEDTKLAFTIVTHDEIGLFEIMLHTIFRPYNAYCIYVGANSPPEYRDAASKVVNCYKDLFPKSTIFMAQDTKEVRWGNFTLIEADLICMDQLLKLKNQ